MLIFILYLRGPTSIHWNLVTDVPGNIPALQRERLLQSVTSNHEEWVPGKTEGKTIHVCNNIIVMLMFWQAIKDNTHLWA